MESIDQPFGKIPYADSSDKKFEPGKAPCFISKAVAKWLDWHVVTIATATCFYRILDS